MIFIFIAWEGASEHEIINHLESSFDSDLEIYSL